MVGDLGEGPAKQGPALGRVPSGEGWSYEHPIICTREAVLGDQAAPLVLVGEGTFGDFCGCSDTGRSCFCLIPPWSPSDIFGCWGGLNYE